MRAGARVVWSLALTLAVAACASAPPPDTFEITVATLADSPPVSGRSQVLIPEPTAIQALDSERIVVKPTRYSIEYLANAQWSDRLPRMVQLRLLQRFENSGVVQAVGLPGQGLAIDYQLIMEIRRFEISVVGPATAEIEISAKALDDRTGNIRRTRVFAVSVPAAGTSNEQFVAALDQAFDRVAGDIVDWMATLA